MANFNARAVPLQTFDAQAKPATDLPGPSGSAADSLKGSIEAFSHLSTWLNSWADKAAESEGSTAGTAAALQQGDNLALRKDGTLTGAAFDKAAIDTRSAQLDTAVRNDLFAQSQKFEGDPDGMKKAFDQVGEAYAAKAGLAPELQAHFDKRFSDLRFAYEAAAVRERDNEVRATAAASYGTAIDTAKRDAAKTAFILGNDPGADDKIAAESGRIKRMVANAAEAGYITPANAAKVTASLDTDLAEQKVRGTFERLTGLEAKQSFLDQLNKDWRDGKALKGFGPDEFQQLNASLATGINKERSLQNQQARTLQAGVDSIRSRVVEGYGIPAAEWGELDAVAQRSNSPELQARLAAGKAEAAMVQKWWTMKPAELGAMIQAERARGATGATERDQSRIDTAEKVYTTMTKEAKDDPLGLAERTGRAAPTALSPAMIDGDADAISGYFAQRKAAAEHSAAEFGVTPKYFLPEEREAWAKVMNDGGAKALAAATLFRQQWDPATARAALREIAPKSSLMAHAADVVVGGGSVDFARDVAKSLEARGMDKFKPVDVKKSELDPLVRETYGAAFSHLSMNVQDTALAAARAAFTARSRAQDVPPELATGKGREIMERSLQEAVGAKYVDGQQYGGVGNVSRGFLAGSYKVAVPSDIRADKFQDVVAAVTDADLQSSRNAPVAADGKPYTARDLRAGKLLAVPGGYRIALGDDVANDPRYVRGADGKPFVLDIAALSDRLHQRMPGAWLGKP